MRADYLSRCVGAKVCDAVPIALLGTEIGQPVSNGRVAVVQKGSVVADGSGYDFTGGILSVDTKDGCAISPYTTLTITGVGPIPDISLHSLPDKTHYVVGAAYEKLYAVYPAATYGYTWDIYGVPVSVASGTDYSLVLVVADTYVRVWLNGSSIGRQTISPNHLRVQSPWQLYVGTYYAPSITYTGRVNSITWEVGALYPDVDNI